MGEEYDILNRQPRESAASADSPKAPDVNAEAIVPAKAEAGNPPAPKAVASVPASGVVQAPSYQGPQVAAQGMQAAAVQAPAMQGADVDARSEADIRASLLESVQTWRQTRTEEEEEDQPKQEDRRYRPVRGAEGIIAHESPAGLFVYPALEDPQMQQLTAMRFVAVVQSAESLNGSGEGSGTSPTTRWKYTVKRATWNETTEAWDVTGDAFFAYNLCEDQNDTTATTILGNGVKNSELDIDSDGTRDLYPRYVRGPVIVYRLGGRYVFERPNGIGGDCPA